MWDWNKLSPISGLSLPIEGLPKVQWGKAEWAAQNQGCGGQRWAVEHLGQPLAHSPCPPQSGVPAFTVLQTDEPLAVLRDRAQQISVSLMELPGVEEDCLGRHFILWALGLLICVRPAGVHLGSRNRVWWVLVDGRADGIREGYPLSSCCLSPPQCPLYLCPPLQALEEGGPPLTLGLEGEHQRSNAALALQVARCWLQQKGYQGKWTGQWVGRGQVDLPLRALRGEDRAH